MDDPASPPEPSRPRAGRNVPVAIAVGLALAGGATAGLLWWPPGFELLTLAGVSVGAFELVRAARLVGARPPLLPAVAGATAVVASPSVDALLGVAGWASLPPDTVMLVSAALAVVAVLVWRMPGGVAGYLRDCAAGVLVVAYVGLLAAFVPLMLLAPDGSRRVLLYVLSTIAGDVGGLAVGVLAGHHHVWAAVSPQKTWEGVAGAAALAAIVGAGFGSLLLSLPWWQGVLFGLAMAALGLVGDLVESAFKRDAGLKHMSHALPGHGGVLDRLDSLLVAAPGAWLLLSLMGVPT